MVSTPKKKYSNRSLFSQLDDLDQDTIIGNNATERRKKITNSEATSDQDFTVCTSGIKLATNENMLNVKTLERCFFKKIDREMSKIVETVEDRIHNGIFTAIDSFVAPMIESANRSKIASSGRNVISVTANSERGEHVRITALFENACGNNNALHRSIVNDETQNNIVDEVSELSVPETHFDRQTHTHHMVTRQRAQTNQILKIFTGRILIPRNPRSHQHQGLSTQTSQDNKHPRVEQTPRNQNSGANICINRLVDAIAENANQQRPQAATMLKPVSTNT